MGRCRPKVYTELQYGAGSTAVKQGQGRRGPLATPSYGVTPVVKAEDREREKPYVRPVQAVRKVRVLDDKIFAHVRLRVE